MRMVASTVCERSRDVAVQTYSPASLRLTPRSRSRPSSDVTCSGSTATPTRRHDNDAPGALHAIVTSLPVARLASFGFTRNSSRSANSQHSSQKYTYVYVIAMSAITLTAY